MQRFRAFLGAVFYSGTTAAYLLTAGAPNPAFAGDGLEGFGTYGRNEIKKRPSPTPSIPPQPTTKPSPSPRPIPAPQSTPPLYPPSDSSGSSGSSSDAALAGLMTGLISSLGGLGGLGSGGAPVGGSGPADPNSSGVVQGSEADQRFNPQTSKENVSDMQKEREIEDGDCEVDCPAEDPGMKGDPNEVAMDSSTIHYGFESGGLESMASDIGNKLGGGGYETSNPAQFCKWLRDASADTSGQGYAFYITTHGARNGGMQGPLSAGGIADCLLAGGAKNKKIVIIHEECYAGAHSSQIAAKMADAGVSQEYRPNQFYSRPGGRCGPTVLKGEQLATGTRGVGITSLKLFNSIQPGQTVVMGNLLSTVQAGSVSGYQLWLQREAVNAGAESKEEP